MSSLGLIDTAFAADLNAIILDPFATDDAGTSILRTRYTSCVSPAYILLFLAGPLTPRQA